MTDVEVKIKTSYDDSGTKKAIADLENYRNRIKSMEAETLANLIPKSDDDIVSKLMQRRSSINDILKDDDGTIRGLIDKFSAEAKIPIRDRQKFLDSVTSKLFEGIMSGVPDIGTIGAGTAQGIGWRDITIKRAQQLEGLRMPLLFFGLSIMFAGMALNKALSGIIQPAAEMSGILEVIGIILSLLFLPAFIALMPVILKLLEMVVSFTESYPELTKWIGLLVIGISIFGAFIMTLGQGLTLLAGILSLLSINGVIGALGTGAGISGTLLGGAGVAGGAGILSKLIPKPQFTPEAGMGGQAFTKPTVPIPEAKSGMKGQFAMPDLGKWGSRLGSMGFMLLAMAEPIGGKNKFDWFNPSTWGEFLTPPTTAYVGDNWMNQPQSTQNITVTNIFNPSNSPNINGGYAMNDSLAPV